MPKKDNLSELIRSLTPNETRYFRLYTSIQPGEKKYMELFDALEKNGSHSNESLCREMNIKPAQLATTKHYLYHLLLRSLRNYDDNASQLSILDNTVEEAKVFVARRMFTQALDVADSALKRAWELEAFEVMDSLLRIKYVCIHNTYQTEKIGEITEMHKKAAEAKDELMEIMHLSTLAQQYEYKRNRAEDFENMLSHPLLKKQPRQLKSLRAAIDWFVIMFRYYFTLEKYSHKCLEIVINEQKFYEKNQQILAINPLAYVVSFTRAANVQYRMKNYKQALEASDTLALKLADPGIEITKARRESMNTYNRMFRADTLVHLGDFEHAIIEAEAIEAVLSTRSEYEQFASTYIYAIALVHLQDNEKANQKINQLLQIKTDARKDLQPYGRVLLIMSQINSGNMDTVPYLVEAAKVWMKRNKYINKEIDLFFKHALAIAKATVNRRREWIKFKDDIEAGKFKQTDSEVLIGRWVDKKPGK